MQVGEDGCHASVLVCGVAQAELEKDLADVPFQRFLCHDEGVGDCAVRTSLGEQSEIPKCSSAWSKVAQRSAGPVRWPGSSSSPSRQDGETE